MRMELVTISYNSLFSAHGYPQLVSGEERGKYCLRYQMSLILGYRNLKDSIAFAYGTSLKEAKKADRKVGGEIGRVAREKSDNVRVANDGHVQVGLLPCDH